MNREVKNVISDILLRQRNERFSEVANKIVNYLFIFIFKQLIVKRCKFKEKQQHIQDDNLNSSPK